jgi:hypothetical protein
MATPSTRLALLILGLLFFIGLVAWYLKSRINTFAEALVAYRQKAQSRSQETNVESATT